MRELRGAAEILMLLDGLKENLAKLEEIIIPQDILALRRKVEGK